MNFVCSPGWPPPTSTSQVLGVHQCAQLSFRCYPRRLGEGSRSFEWKLNLLEDQPALLTTKPSLIPPPLLLEMVFSVSFKLDSAFRAQGTLPMLPCRLVKLSTPNSPAVLRTQPLLGWASARPLGSLTISGRSTRTQASRLKLRKKDLQRYFSKPYVTIFVIPELRRI